MIIDGLQKVSETLEICIYSFKQILRDAPIHKLIKMPIYEGA